MTYNVLLVDDEEPIRNLLKTVLELGEFSVRTAESAAEAIKVLGCESFDIIVTDLRMETPLAGYDVVKAANRDATHPLKVILTAFPVPAVEWRRVGADALITKGGETLRLVDRLRTLLLHRHRPSGSHAHPRQPSK